MLFSSFTSRVGFLSGGVARTLATHNLRAMPTCALTKSAITLNAMRKYATQTELVADKVTKPTKKAASDSKSKASTGKSKKEKVTKPVKKEKKEESKIIITKDDLPPKKPLSAYFIFFKQKIRARTKPEGVGALEYAHGVAREASAEWKSMTLQDKAEYINRAQAAREEYNEKMAQYTRDLDYAKYKEINRQRKSKGKQQLHLLVNPNPRPLTAFFRFLEMYRNDKPAGTMIDIAVEASRAWKAMTPEEKLPYVTESRDAMQAWRAKNAKV